MRITGTGRYAREVYPTRSNSYPAGAAFTPAFQSADGNANLGTDGSASGTYAVIGGLLYATGVFLFGAGATAGVGLFLPFPPGFTAANINSAVMPIIGSSGSIIEAATQTLTSGLLGGTSTVIPSDYFLETDGTTVLEQEWEIDLSALVEGDQIFFTYILPLR